MLNYRTENHGIISGGIDSRVASVKSMAKLGDIAIITIDLWNSITALAEESAEFGPLNNRGYPINFYEELQRKYTQDYLETASRAFGSLPQDPYLKLIGPVIRGFANELSNPIPSIHEELDLDGRMINIPIKVLDANRVRVGDYVLPAFDFASFCYECSPGVTQGVMFFVSERANPDLKDLKKAIRKSKNPAFREFNEFYKNIWEEFYSED